MKVKILGTLIILFLAGAGWVGAEENMVLKDPKDRMSYSIGVDMGNKVKNMPVNVDAELILRGVKDVLSGAKLLMSEQEVRELQSTLQKEISAKSEEQKKKVSETNKKEGEKFLAENKKKEGVIALPSGLQYRVLKAGTGKSPTEADRVKINFRGNLIDGSEFENTLKNFRQPIVFPVRGIMPGWTEALKLMQEGAKWQVFVPGDLAFGERGSGTLIGPNATLILEIELMSIEQKK